MIEPEQSDKQCRGKSRLSGAQQARVCGARGIPAVRHGSFPGAPIWDSGQDAAGPLRAHCGPFGLARINPPDLLLHLTDLLLDRTKRRGPGAQGVRGSGSRAAIPLLRFKARIGDTEAEVLGECFTALLARRHSITTVRRPVP